MRGFELFFRVGRGAALVGDGAPSAFGADGVSGAGFTSPTLMPSIKRLVRESGRPVPRQVATSMTVP